MPKVPTKSFPKIKAVDYNQIRSEIQDGDVLLCSGNGWFSKAIQSVTKSPWSHVGFVYWWHEMDRLMVMESVETIGVRTVPFSRYLNNYDGKGKPYPGGFILIRHDDFTARFTDARKKKLGQFAASRLGYKYDNDEIAKISARIMASYIPGFKSSKKELSHDEEYICSEFVHRCYKEINISVKHNTKGFIAPSDFSADPKFNLMWNLKSK